MPKQIKVAAIQMDGASAPTQARLDRAAKLVAEAAEAGAQLVVLPELFNTGSSYAETNYERTEAADGLTMTWLCQQAQMHNIHIAGSFLLVDVEDTYNSAFLVAPDGHTWRYDKRYPYLWERAFYRDGQRITVADTALGKIGMIIGWDAGHADVWDRYAGRVDLLLVMNDLQDISEAELAFPDGKTVYVHDLGLLVSWAADDSSYYLGDDIEQQAKWAGIPVVSAGASGEFRSIFPMPFFSVGTATVMRPDLWQKVRQTYADVKLVAPFADNTRIIGADGSTIARAETSGDAYTLADLELPDLLPIPHDEQPVVTMPSVAYPIVDVIGAAFYTFYYRRSVRRQWGARMAPIEANTYKWLGIVMVTMVISAIIGQLFPRRRR